MPWVGSGLLSAGAVDPFKKPAQAFVLGVEDLVRRAALDDVALVKKRYAVGDRAGEPNFVRRR